jgi:O-acetyl-ADP-ribose deacetylase (regulator of RNase III)
MIKIVDGNLLDATETYICHQCNCVGVGAAGVAAAIFSMWPETNVYARRNKVASEAGSIEIVHSPSDERPHVVNMFSQYNPGGPARAGHDGPSDRVYWFKMALNQIIRQTEPGATYAFPYKIGCGIGGGDWGLYIDVLKTFETYIKGDVVLYHLRPVG